MILTKNIFIFNTLPYYTVEIYLNYKKWKMEQKWSKNGAKMGHRINTVNIVAAVRGCQYKHSFTVIIFGIIIGKEIKNMVNSFIGIIQAIQPKLTSH